MFQLANRTVEEMSQSVQENTIDEASPSLTTCKRKQTCEVPPCGSQSTSPVTKRRRNSGVGYKKTAFRGMLPSQLYTWLHHPSPTHQLIDPEHVKYQIEDVDEDEVQSQHQSEKDTTSSQQEPIQSFAIAAALPYHVKGVSKAVPPSTWVPPVSKVLNNQEIPTITIAELRSRLARSRRPNSVESKAPTTARLSRGSRLLSLAGSLNKTSGSPDAPSTALQQLDTSQDMHMGILISPEAQPHKDPTERGARLTNADGNEEMHTMADDDTLLYLNEGADALLRPASQRRLTQSPYSKATATSSGLTGTPSPSKNIDAPSPMCFSSPKLKELEYGCVAALRRVSFLLEDFVDKGSLGETQRLHSPEAPKGTEEELLECEEEEEEEEEEPKRRAVRFMDNDKDTDTVCSHPKGVDVNHIDRQNGTSTIPARNLKMPHRSLCRFGSPAYQQRNGGIAQKATEVYHFVADFGTTCVAIGSAHRMEEEDDENEPAPLQSSELVVIKRKLQQRPNLIRRLRQSSSFGLQSDILDLRQAVLNARLADYHEAGETWARMDITGVELGVYGVQQAHNKLRTVLGSLGAATYGEIATTEFLRQLEREWDHLRAVRQKYTFPSSRQARGILKHRQAVATPTCTSTIPTMSEYHDLILAHIVGTPLDGPHNTIPAAVREPIAAADVRPVDLTPGAIPSRGIKMLQHAVATLTNSADRQQSTGGAPVHPSSWTKRVTSRGARLLKSLQLVSLGSKENENTFG